MEIHKNETPPEHYEHIVVAPGFENNKHNSGLYWDTRSRLRAAAILYKKGVAENIVVGGAQLRQMPDSFANSMKRWMVERLHIPEEVIETEEDTYDTPSQFKGIKDHQEDIFKEGKSAFITDREQAKHVRALIKGFGITNMDVLTTHDIFSTYSAHHDAKFLNHIEHSGYWLKWRARELVLTALTRTIDPRGELISRITSKRKQ